MLIGVEILPGIAGKEVRLAVGKQLGERDVDGAHGAVEVDRAEQLGADGDEADQRGQPALVDGQPARREDAVVKESFEVEGAGVVARHVGVAEDEVHVVDRVEAAKQTAEQAEPMEGLVVGLARAADEEGDLGGVEHFTGFEAAAGIAAHGTEEMAQLMLDDVGTEGFVGEAVVGEEVVIEEMAERAVSHVMEQRGHAQQRLDVGLAGHLGADLAEAGVQLVGGTAGEEHGTEHVLEAGVFRAGKDPPCRLELMDLAESLHPGVIDDLLFGDLALR